MFQLAADRAGGLGHRKGLFHLAQDLRFPHNHGVKAGRHAEEMPHRLPIAVVVNVRGQLCRIDPKVAVQKVG